MESINILVTLDENYIPPLRAMLKSMFISNPGETFRVYMIHGGISQDAIRQLNNFCVYHGDELMPILVEDNAFAQAPVFRYYTKEMYYRLLACKLLPETMSRILYLDPDTLIINPLRELYETDLSGYLFGGCRHIGITGISEHVNKIRLNTYETEGYFNSGVLLMNLDKQRETIREADIYEYVSDHKNELILPDQDILNGLYGENIRPLDDSLYNYDARRYESYRMASLGEKDLEWVINNTAIIHFCGKNKPWRGPNRSRFGILYKHYASLAERTMKDQNVEPAIS